MGEAKNIILKAITSKRGNEFIKKYHYSGKVVNNSQLHIGVFKGGILGGVLQFGCSLDKRKIMGLVNDTGWNEFVELNRMAFSDLLPRNSESRAIAISMRLLKKHAPHIKWVISFADATQCGDGIIYRASGFVLTGIKRNVGTWVLPSGEVVNSCTYGKSQHARNNNGSAGGSSLLKSKGAVKAGGFQLRYIYFIDKSCRERLTVPEVPFSKIQEMGAGMYKGKSSAVLV